MDPNRRSSLSFNEQSIHSKPARHSISTSTSQSDKKCNNIYDAIIKDPAKRALVLQLLSQEKIAIKDYMQKNGLVKKTPNKKKKVVHCESPTVLHRRRAMEQMLKSNKETQMSSSTSDSSDPSPLPFEKLLDGVIAYVEVKTRDGDRSAAVKSVIRAMGATVRDHFTKDVTHVIFKDGSFRTYQRAKMVKAHLVSLLWVEAVKTNQVRVPEKNFPALGTGAFDANMSMVCQQFHDEYNEALKEECKQAVTGLKTPQNNPKKTAIPSEILKSLRKHDPRISEESDDSLDCIPNSQDNEVQSILTSKRPVDTLKSINHDCYSVCSLELTSDSSCGPMIDGEITQNLIESLYTSSDKSSDDKIMRSIENLEHSQTKKNCRLAFENCRKPQEKTSYTPVEMDFTVISNERISNENSLLKRMSINSSKHSLETGAMPCLQISSNASLKNESLNNSDKRRTDSSSATISGLIPKSSIDSEKLHALHIPHGETHRLRISLEKGVNESSSGNRRTGSSSTTISGLLPTLESEKMPPLHISDERSNLQKSTESGIMPPLRISDTSVDKSNPSLPEKVPLIYILREGDKSKNDFKNVVEKRSLQKSAESDVMPPLCISDSSADKNNSLVPGKVPSSNSSRNGPNDHPSSSETHDFTKPKIQEKKSRRRTIASSLTSNYIEQSSINLDKMQVSSHSSIEEIPESSNNLISCIKGSRKSISSSNNKVKPSNMPPRTNLRRTRSSISNFSRDSENIEKPKTNKKRSVSNSSLSSVHSSRENLQKSLLVSEEDLKESANTPAKTFKRKTRSSVSNASLRSLQMSKGILEKSSVSNSLQASEDLEASSNIQVKPNLGSKRKRSVQTPKENLEKPSNTAAKTTLRRTRSNTLISTDQSKRLTLETEELPPLCVSDDKSKSSLDCTKESPPKRVKIQEELYKTPEKSQSGNNRNKAGKSSKRKLYNPDDSIGTILPLANDEEAKKQVAKDIFKKPEGLTPILVTVKAKKFLKNKGEMASQNTDSTQQSDQIKVPIMKKREEKNKEEVKNSSREKNEKIFKQPEPVPTRTTRRQSMLSLSRQNSSSQIEENPITPIKRRSTMDFVASQASKSVKSSQRVSKNSGIVCTRLHRPECKEFCDIVKELGGFFVEDKVTSQTTHLVAGEARRTINLLRAVARGCWIVKQEWLHKSRAAGKWLPEEDFELTEFSRSVQRCRIERQAFGPSYTMDIFRNSGYIYVAKSSVPPCSELQELIRLCKGKITTSRMRACIVVGEKLDKDDVICLKELWVLDSIEHKRLKSFKNYLYD